jgi:UDP:flavonoid glycosyltransferase YjiC (YdhE family)
MNSVNESLFYKVPLVMIPQTTEQKGVANRVNQVGAGIFLKNENPKTIFDTVTQVLNNSTYSQNAKIISDSFKNCSGPQGAAKKILSCIR